jgi:hypothetical protein
MCITIRQYPHFEDFALRKKKTYAGVNLVVYTKASCSLFCLHSSLKEEKPLGTSLFICVLSEIVELFD